MELFFAFSTDLILALEAAAAFFGFLLIARLPELHEVRRKIAPESSPLRDVIGITKMAVKHPEIKWLMLFPAIYAGFTLILFWILQPVMTAALIPVALFGLFVGINQGSRAVFSKIAHKAKEFFGVRKLLLLCLGLLAAGFIAAILAVHSAGNIALVYAVSAFIAVIPATQTMASLIFKDYIHNKIKSDERGTILSIYAMFNTGISGIMMILAKPMLDNFGITATMLVCLGALIVILFPLKKVLAIKGIEKMKNELLKELAARGFIHQFSNLDGLDDLLNNQKIALYYGADPTADSLHYGHIVPIMMMRWFQKFGHKPIMLVGGATGRIGDPSGRDSGRPMMTEETLVKNIAGLRRSYEKILGSGNFIQVDNYDWMKGYGHLDFLRDFGSDFTIPRMLSMESVKRRLETGMTFLEFNYMTFQALDFLELYKKYKCQLQICGADQWGNSIMGIELIRKKTGKEVFVLSTPIITDAAGNKIGKSAGNAVWINEDKTSPYEYYQVFRNVSDADVEKVFEDIHRNSFGGNCSFGKIARLGIKRSQKDFGFCSN